MALNNGENECIKTEAVQGSSQVIVITKYIPEQEFQQLLNQKHSSDSSNSN